MTASQTYNIVMENVTIANDATLIILHSASSYASRGSVLELIRVSVSQQGTTTSQQLGIILAQKVSAFGTYTATTPSPLVIGTVASAITGATDGTAGTAGTDATAEGGGTVTTVDTDGFNNLNGYLWVPTPEDRIRLGPDLAFIVKLRGSPTTTSGWNAKLTFRELT